MKKGNYFKAMGLIGAIFLVTFGSIKNFGRTVMLGWKKLNRHKK